MRKRIELIAEVAEGALTLTWGFGLISMSLWFWVTVPLGAIFFINLAVDACRRCQKPLAFLYGLLIVAFVIIGLVMLSPH